MAFLSLLKASDGFIVYQTKQILGNAHCKYIFPTSFSSSEQCDAKSFKINETLKKNNYYRWQIAKQQQERTSRTPKKHYNYWIRMNKRGKQADRVLEDDIFFYLECFHICIYIMWN